jgi:hypothetical protein
LSRCGKLSARKNRERHHKFSTQYKSQVTVLSELPSYTRLMRCTWTVSSRLKRMRDMRLGQIKSMLVVSNNAWSKHSNYFPAVLLVYRSSNRFGFTFRTAYFFNATNSLTLSSYGLQAFLHGTLSLYLKVHTIALRLLLYLRDPRPRWARCPQCELIVTIKMRDISRS